MEKNFKTIDEQIEILKEKNLIIEDEETANMAMRSAITGHMSSTEKNCLRSWKTDWRKNFTPSSATALR